ncbi:uncharacterized protein LOC142241854 [Haematobia irritans]|uniref:uncharacterized protein LOC142241854 n=1 Tax=Haematobia irritans TaxID=7368 RepID=UPI003F50D412
MINFKSISILVVKCKTCTKFFTISYDSITNFKRDLFRASIKMCKHVISCYEKITLISVHETTSYSFRIQRYLLLTATVLLIENIDGKTSTICHLLLLKRDYKKSTLKYIKQAYIETTMYF